MIIIFRTIILYIVVVFSLRFMGKKQIGQLQPSELAVAIMISELASIPMESKDSPLLNGIIPVLVLVICEIVVSFIILKNVKIRKVITGKPSIIVEKGILKEKILKDLRFTTDDLIEEMRINGIMNISDIQYAILETNGQVSFILNKNASPPNAHDLYLNLEEEMFPFPIVNKGEILKENLKTIGRDENWIYEEIKMRNITNIKSILILCANNNGIKYLQLMER